MLNEISFNQLMDVNIQQPRNDMISPIKIPRDAPDRRESTSKFKIRKFQLPRTNSPFPDFKHNYSVVLSSSRLDNSAEEDEFRINLSLIKDESPGRRPKKIYSDLVTPSDSAMNRQPGDKQPFFRSPKRKEAVKASQDLDETPVQLPLLIKQKQEELANGDFKSNGNELKKTHNLFQDIKESIRKIKEDKLEFKDYYNHYEADSHSYLKHKRTNIPSAGSERHFNHTPESRKMHPLRQKSDDKITVMKRKLQEFREVFSPKRKESRRGGERQTDRSYVVTFSKNCDTAHTTPDEREPQSFVDYVREESRRVVSQEAIVQSPLIEQFEEDAHKNIYEKPRTSNKSSKTPKFGKAKKDFKINLQKLPSAEVHSENLLNNSKDTADESYSPKPFIGGGSPGIPRCFKIRPNSRKKLNVRKQDNTYLMSEPSCLSPDIDALDSSMISLQTSSPQRRVVPPESNNKFKPHLAIYGKFMKNNSFLAEMNAQKKNTDSKKDFSLPSIPGIKATAYFGE